MFDHPVIWLSIVTLLLVLGFAVWNLATVRKQQKTGGNTTGLGGKNDPMA